MFKIGLSIGDSIPVNDKTFFDLSHAGIQAIEYSMNYNKIMETDFDELKRLADKYGIELWSMHLPISPYPEGDFTSLVPEYAERSLNAYTYSLKKGASVGIKHFITHLGCEPTEEEKPDRIKVSRTNMTALLDEAEKEGVTIALENCPRANFTNCIAGVKNFLSMYPRLKICFDTNHNLIDSNLDFIEAFKDYIVTTHISDYDFINERHWMPGEGKVDWVALSTKLKQVGYNGVWMYEVSTKDRTYDDFVTNAKTIFSGINP